jgi:hypothetical protein
MTSLFAVIWLQLRARATLLREQDRGAGYSTETVVVTAILVALALLVVGTIIYNKVVGKANGINL